MKTLALFDFDGTITAKDSFIEFIKFSFGVPKFLLGFSILSPFLILFKLSLYPNQKAKERVLRYYFGGMELNVIEHLAKNFSKEVIPDILRGEAMRKLNWHKEQGHEVVVVSASAEIWLRDWCTEHSIHLIGSRMEVLNGKVTGLLTGKNCHGDEKVVRIKEQYNLEDYEVIYAYGDSAGDNAMLSVANFPFYRKFDD